MRKAVKDLLAEYGAIAVVVYFAIFFSVLFGFRVAISFGWKPSSTAGNVGVWTAAYVATKITQPFRIVATIAVTPLVGKLYERIVGRTRKPSS